MFATLDRLSTRFKLRHLNGPPTPVRRDLQLPSFSSRRPVRILERCSSRSPHFGTRARTSPLGLAARSSAGFTTKAESNGRADVSLDPDRSLHVPDTCPGCGVRLQADDPGSPGYYRVPEKLLTAPEKLMTGSAHGKSEELAAESDNIEESTATQGGLQGTALEARSPRIRHWDDWDSWEEGEEEEDEEEEESWNLADEPQALHNRIVCARCYSLTHYGQVKSREAEALVPAFDLGREVGRQIRAARGRRAVVLCVVDAADFDGSLPRAALRDIFPAPLLEGSVAGVRGDALADDSPCLVLAVNKADLLPRQVTALRLEKWVRRRARQGGLPPPAHVCLVSAATGGGVADLLRSLHAEATATLGCGSVWVVGAQNAGKSSLINAMRRAVGRSRPDANLTTAALPGTTLGLLPVHGLMPPACAMFDTPGVPHRFQLTSRLPAADVRMLLPRRQLKPRTFRAGAGQTVMVGGCGRVDIVAAPAATLYLTVWASEDIICHLGKTSGADERYAKAVGTILVPPIGEATKALGALVPKDVTITGNSWRESCADISFAGLGWVAVAVRGAASLRAWAHNGVGVATRDALVPDLARAFERPGFTNRDRTPKRGAASIVPV